MSDIIEVAVIILVLLFIMVGFTARYLSKKPRPMTQAATIVTKSIAPPPYLGPADTIGQKPEYSTL